MKITVFTPTYNRAYIIENLYRSLQRQTYRDFEWLIVDDGSVDETEQLVFAWLTENDFPIRYYKKENGGKCSAINYALDLAQGELFFIMDSDDYLTDDALEKVAKWEEELPKDQKFCGVAGNLGVSENNTPNTIFEEDFLDCSLLKRYENIDGERAMVFYTDIHRQYKYPIFEGENFMTEAVVWNRIANDGYKMRFYNDIIWVYEYREDGLTKAGNSIFVNNPMGYGLWLREKSKFMGEGLKQRLKLYYTFTCDLSGKHNTKTIAKAIGAPRILIAFIKFARKILGK
ncbi:MAG: glycosyltransferase family 2 protein [Clostridia bacterium]|nr:glycosyltransferase family 2 protein [Clostridia bacterium]